jgi:hypothetical protein
MIIAVTDANIFIDLIQLDLIAYLFEIDYEVHVTREVIDQLNEDQFVRLDPFVQNKSLSVYDFSAAEIEAIHLADAPRALEFADKTVVFLALRLEATVLTGDGPLRKFCILKGLPVKGILWLLDTFLATGQITRPIAYEKLKTLVGFNGRLPKEQCLERLDLWK